MAQNNDKLTVHFSIDINQAKRYLNKLKTESELRQIDDQFDDMYSTINCLGIATDDAED